MTADTLRAPAERAEAGETGRRTVPWPDNADGSPVSILSPAGRARLTMLSAMAKKMEAE